MGEIREAMAGIEKDLDAMLADGLINPEHRDTAKLLLVAREFGCKNIDELAFRAHLPRDRFVRPRARRLRASGIWNRDGTTTSEYPDGPPTHTNIEFVLHILCAEGDVVCRWPAREASVDMLLAWRLSALPSPCTPEVLAESLSVEAMATNDIPVEYERAVVAFRHLNQDERLKAAQSVWLRCRPHPWPTSEPTTTTTVPVGSTRRPNETEPAES